MAKKIYINEDDINRILEEVKNEISGNKCYGSIKIEKTFVQDSRKAIVYFSTCAWSKLKALVNEFDTEVQWHGLVKRVSVNEFLVYDIIVPPHVVTSATVTSDQEKYCEWINALDDETFNSLHFHGHSHVNMGCSPSNVDMTYRRDIATQLPVPQDENEDSFYIFMIFNKKNEWTGEIYDIANNALYGTKEITIDIYCEEDGLLLSNFVAEARKLAIKETPKPVATVKSVVVSSSWDNDAKNKGKKSEKGTNGNTYSGHTVSNFTNAHTYDDDDSYGGYYSGNRWW